MIYFNWKYSRCYRGVVVEDAFQMGGACSSPARKRYWFLIYLDGSVDVLSALHKLPELLQLLVIFEIHVCTWNLMIYY